MFLLWGDAAGMGEDMEELGGEWDLGALCETPKDSIKNYVKQNKTIQAIEPRHKTTRSWTLHSGLLFRVDLDSTDEEKEAVVSLLLAPPPQERRPT